MAKLTNSSMYATPLGDNSDAFVLSVGWMKRVSWGASAEAGVEAIKDYAPGHENEENNLRALDDTTEKMRERVRRLGYSDVQAYYKNHANPEPVIEVLQIGFGHSFHRVILSHPIRIRFAPDFRVLEKERERGLSILSAIYSTLALLAKFDTRIRISPLSAGVFAGREFKAIIDALSGSTLFLSSNVHVCAFTEREFTHLQRSSFGIPDS
jgi:hypothetical protein